ncbi:MAG: hypothetical protein JHD16_03430, partial [Solirubrobacteraceae bacterium]|nr:hypothetical protein [Solirubrobacteraceae bacterium]
MSPVTSVSLVARSASMLRTVRGLRARRSSLAVVAGSAFLPLLGSGAATAAELKPAYSIVGGCYALQDQADGGFVARDSRGYGLVERRSGATAFRLQATALGRYLLFGEGGKMPQATSPLTWRTTPALPADWVIDEDGPVVRITSHMNGRTLSPGSGDRVTVRESGSARWELVPTDGCATFPELQVGASGVPFKGASPTAPVRGFLDTHTHVSAYRFIGGKFHCGRPWSPYGVSVAMKDCPDHGTDGSTALVENLLTYGNLTTKHDTTGWPS